MNLLHTPVRSVAPPIKAASPLPCDGFLAVDIDEARLPCGCYLARTDRGDFILSFCSLHAMAGDLLAVLEGLLVWENLMGGFEAKPWREARRLVAVAGLSSKPLVASKPLSASKRSARGTPVPFSGPRPRLGEGHGPRRRTEMNDENCHPRCRSSRGKRCACRCGGKHHGSARSVMASADGMEAIDPAATLLAEGCANPVSVDATAAA